MDSQLHELKVRVNYLLRISLRVQFVNGHPLMSNSSLYKTLGILSAENVFKLRMFKLLILLLRGVLPNFYNALLRPYERCEIGCMFGRKGMDVLASCETKVKGKGEVTFGEVTGRVPGVERESAREGVALLLSDWMVNKVVEWKDVSSRLMWVRVRMGRERLAFVSAYGLSCERSEEERDEFWNQLTRCVYGLSTRNYVVVLGDLNARVGDGEVENVIGKYGIPGENESSERLLDMCVEQELVIRNSFFSRRKG